ncbi:hypothetical protein VTN00DRAFT_5508 [Thermoascus crustaceus]|uniref:uncharacterized protein n=1 Tax=Thermoascus crustaceus TaxID=5088 RepID=UPI0037447DE3
MERSGLSGKPDGFQDQQRREPSVLSRAPKTMPQRQKRLGSIRPKLVPAVVKESRVRSLRQSINVEREGPGPTIFPSAPGGEVAKYPESVVTGLNPTVCLDFASFVIQAVTKMDRGLKRR